MNGVQTCHDGDPTCDADGTVDGTCTFRVGVCFNHVGKATPKCQARPVTGYRLVSPTIVDKDSVVSADATALFAALNDLGGGVGKKNTVVFTSPILTETCTAPARVRVAVETGKKSGLTIRGITRSQPADRDEVRLRCVAPTT